jgi:hypothetical protein
MTYLTRRAGIKAIIDASPIVVTISRRELVDDGFGGQVELESTGQDVQEGTVRVLDDGEQLVYEGEDLPTVKARVRISQEASSVQKNGPEPAGIGTSFAAYVLTDYAAPLREGDEISAGSNTWRVGPVDVTKEGQHVIFTRAPLTKVTV